MGVERCVRLDGLTAEQINAKLEELAKAGWAFIAQTAEHFFFLFFFLPANLNKVQLQLCFVEDFN